MNKTNLPAEPEHHQSATGDDRSSFQWRALTSVTVTVSFLALSLSGGVLWASPPGRIANWTNWSMLGLHKHDWAGLHIWFGLLFAVASVFHAILNWRPLLGYFRSKTIHRFGFRREWLAAAFLCMAVFVGTRTGVPPFSTLLAFTDHFRESWEKPNERPPIPHAELLTVRELAENAGMDLTNALVRLEASGIKGSAPDLRVGELAKRNRLPAQRVYDLMVDASGGDGKPYGSGQGKRGGGSGNGGSGGFGRKTLGEFCQEEGIDVTTALARLEAKGFKTSAGQTLREIAVAHGYQRPNELMEIIRGEP